ncbi:MAG: hypothetical protein B6D38_01815 [Anaerolineae bacterium UTCFX1]|jgi:hypothetical protein|nr:MAG: hypothetical protein B6D38_01815 [Anaerolineae bacterium UTCFX1]
MKRLSKLVDRMSNFFAHRKGLLPMLGMALIAINFALPFFFGATFIASSNLFLHLGAIIAIFGFMLAWAL